MATVWRRYSGAKEDRFVLQSADFFRNTATSSGILREGLLRLIVRTIAAKYMVTPTKPSRLGHREQFEDAGAANGRQKLLYTSRRGRRSKW